MSREDEDFVRHLQSLNVPLTSEQLPSDRRHGLDRNTEEGALVAFSGSLRRSNPVHRAVAWVLLIAFGLPGALTLLWLGGQGLHWLWSQAS